MKGDVTSGQSLMLWFQKDSLDIVGFGTFRVGSGLVRSPDPLADGLFSSQAGTLSRSGFPKLLRSIFPLCES